MAGRSTVQAAPAPGSRSLILVCDDGFSPAQFTQLLAFRVIE